MSFVKINPRYADLMARLNLRMPREFLALPAVIVSGHPDRNVGRIMLDKMPGFIKREHRVRWRDRLGGWLAGYGFETRSAREARTISALKQAGIGCPDWLAFGEDDAGCAFLVVRALTDSVELRQHLKTAKTSSERRLLARGLGEALARMHAAGFDHPDLFSKHIFVSKDGQKFHFLDWQRSRRGLVNDRQRARDLATLNATLDDTSVCARDRLECLRSYAAYCTALESDVAPATWHARAFRRLLFSAVRAEMTRLVRKRRIREARVLSRDSQELIRLKGEALCITPQLLHELGGTVPHWLNLERAAWKGADTDSSLVLLPSGREALLVRRRRSQPLRWLWSEFRGKPLMTHEAHQAGLLFRRQRRGESAPRLLAFGQRRTLPWRTESFLLTVAPAEGRER
jgi:tRNA A-37 threonylcarbamoyl transferase component Bud32